MKRPVCYALQVVNREYPEITDLDDLLEGADMQDTEVNDVRKSLSAEALHPNEALKTPFHDLALALIAQSIEDYLFFLYQPATGVFCIPAVTDDGAAIISKRSGKPKKHRCRRVSKDNYEAAYIFLFEESSLSFWMDIIGQDAVRLRTALKSLATDREQGLAILRRYRRATEVREES